MISGCQVCVVSMSCWAMDFLFVPQRGPVDGMATCPLSTCLFHGPSWSQNVLFPSGHSKVSYAWCQPHSGSESHLVSCVRNVRLGRDFLGNIMRCGLAPTPVVVLRRVTSLWGGSCHSDTQFTFMKPTSLRTSRGSLVSQPVLRLGPLYSLKAEDE